MQKDKKFSKPKKGASVNNRIHTQVEQLRKKEDQSEKFVFNDYLETEKPIQKKKISCKALQKQLMTLKIQLEKQLEHLLSGELHGKAWKQAELLLHIKSFRTKDLNYQQMLDEYGKIIQGIQLIYSKLHNNQKVKEVLHVKNEQDFLLFFKYLFGKPYNLCNLPYFRKILDIIWQKQVFPDFGTQKIINHLKLWVHGIQMPLNPSAIQLHKLVFQSPQQIKKFTSFLKNNIVYCNINSGDCSGLTPLQVAAQANATNAYSYLIKAGADLFGCPLTLSKGKIELNKKVDKNKQTIQISFLQHNRLQYNSLELLLAHKQYQQIVDILAHDEINKIKKMRKSKAILEKLSQTPDCCFQIDWKTCKGFLSFKQLPKDIITVRKKGGYLRIDYHIDDIEKTSKVGFYSILLKSSEDHKLQYYFIDHRQKKVVNLLKQIHKDKLKTRYDQFINYGCTEQLEVSNLKSVTKSGSKSSTQISCDFYYQNVNKAPLFKFKTQSDYEKYLVDSDLINYKNLQKNQLQSTIKQQILNQIPKVKSKYIKFSNTFTIQWMEKEELNLQNFLDILKILDNKSIMFIKITKILSILIEEPCFNNCAEPMSDKLPHKIQINGPINSTDISLEIVLKNLVYMQKDGFSDELFQVNYCVEEMGYHDEGEGLQSLQQTVIMDESYTINVSSFLGKTQRMSEMEDIEANRKFQELLTRQIQHGSEDEDGFSSKKIM